MSLLFSPKISAERRAFTHAIIIPCILSLIMILVFALENGMGWDFHKAGVLPRHWENFGGVFTYIFIHSDWGHLGNNIFSFIVLSSCLYFFYKTIASKILFVSYILSGMILWLIGRENWHIGASGLVYSLAFFLFFSGIIRKYVPLIAISFFVVFMYGSMVWYVFPWKAQEQISWEGHLAGAITGLLLAVLSRNYGPQKPEINWEEEEEEENEGIQN